MHPGESVIKHSTTQKLVGNGPNTMREKHPHECLLQNTQTYNNPEGTKLDHRTLFCNCLHKILKCGKLTCSNSQSSARNVSSLKQCSYLKLQFQAHIMKLSVSGCDEPLQISSTDAFGEPDVKGLQRQASLCSPTLSSLLLCHPVPVCSVSECSPCRRPSAATNAASSSLFHLRKAPQEVTGTRRLLGLHFSEVRCTNGALTHCRRCVAPVSIGRMKVM